VSFGDVLISFEIEMSISEDDDSRQVTDHTPPVCHRKFLCNACVTYYVNVFIHSLLCLFVVLVILKVRVQLYRPINYWLCVVCFYSFSPPVFNLSALMCN